MYTHIYIYVYCIIICIYVYIVYFSRRASLVEEDDGLVQVCSGLALLGFPAQELEFMALG